MIYLIQELRRSKTWELRKKILRLRLPLLSMKLRYHTKWFLQDLVRLPFRVISETVNLILWGIALTYVALTYKDWSVFKKAINQTYQLYETGSTDVSFRMTAWWIRTWLGIPFQLSQVYTLLTLEVDETYELATPKNSILSVRRTK